MDVNTDSIIVREAIIKALEKLKKTAEPSMELKKALKKMQATLRPFDELRKSSAVIQRATKSLNEFQQTYSDAAKLKEIIEEHERE